MPNSASGLNRDGNLDGVGFYSDDRVPRENMAITVCTPAQRIPLGKIMTATTLIPPSADRAQSGRVLPRVISDLPKSKPILGEQTISSELNAKLENVRRICEPLTSHVDVQAIYYYETQELRAHCVFSLNETQELVSLGRVLDAACRAAQRSGKFDLLRQAAPARTLIAIPIETENGPRAAIGISLTGDFSNSMLGWLAAAVANAFACECSKSKQLELEREVSETAAVIDLIEDAMEADTLQNTCQRLITKLQTFAPASRIAIGYRRGSRKTFRLTAISGHTRFDRQSSLSNSLESLMTELSERGSLVNCETVDVESSCESARHVAVALGGDCQRVLGIPLSIRDRECMGALVLMGKDADLNSPRIIEFLQAAGPSMASVLAAAERSERSYAGKILRRMGDTWIGRWRLAFVGLLSVIGIVLCIPMTYKIECPSLVEPIHRRFVAAPFDGTLERAIAKPGEFVHQGDLIAKMDDREIKWKRASVLADQNQAQKKRDTAQAGHSYAEQQIAQLEFERLQIELQMLDDRAANLEITSPIDGIVTSGDLARVEGAPLSVGQTLFEIAPTDRMVAEVAIVDHEIARAKEGQPVDIQFDAYPGSSWNARIQRMRPRAEVRDNLNVFVAEVELDNVDMRLRPGMKGRAKIHSDKRAYGWILFHQLFEFIARKVSW